MENSSVSFIDLLPDDAIEVQELSYGMVFKKPGFYYVTDKEGRLSHFGVVQLCDQSRWGSKKKDEVIMCTGVTSINEDQRSGYSRSTTFATHYEKDGILVEHNGYNEDEFRKRARVSFAEWIKNGIEDSTECARKALEKIKND